MEYNSFRTGESYKLQELFSKDNKIIIPDLQRDYCWGTTNDKEGRNLVERFIDNLIENKDKELNLGLLYGYEAPLGHIQLCDGQQRITTLFLLLGMLNKKTTNNNLRRFLISEEEENDDWEPYLQYSIRESSLYFLSDLTRFFFIEKKDLSVSYIKMQPWYFKDYDLDPSIQSMISAMEIIENKIQNIDCQSFGEYIAERLTFLYYDMGNRTKGEETFVIINTTGEPLSLTENLKPLLINKQPEEKQDECARKWEQWEQFFWKNRGENDTADSGLEEFFRWIMLLQYPADSKEFKSIQNNGRYKFDVNIPFDFIDVCFKIVSEKLFSDENAVFPNNRDWLAPSAPADPDDKGIPIGNTQIVWFRLLPIIEYLYRFPDATTRELRRVTKFFSNLAKVPDIKKDLYNRDINRLGKVLPDAIRIAKEMPTRDICSVLQLDGISTTLMSEEVNEKLQILFFAKNREEVEESFWKEEESGLWSGEIMPMILWATTDNLFDYSAFELYRAKFNKLFHDDLEYEELDITRRALLTRDLKDYPRKYKRDKKNWSFALENEDWKILIKDNVDKFKYFLDDLDLNDIYKFQKEMIANNPANKDFDEFVKRPELLQYCEHKNIRWWGEEWGWILIKKTNATTYADLKTYQLYFELLELLKTKGIKHPVWLYNEKTRSCAVIDENEEHNGWAVDVWHSGNDKYELNLFRRNVSVENTFGNIPSLFNLDWNGERYERNSMTKQEAIDTVWPLVSELSKI